MTLHDRYVRDQVEYCAEELRMMVRDMRECDGVYQHILEAAKGLRDMTEDLARELRNR